MESYLELTKLVRVGDCLSRVFVRFKYGCRLIPVKPCRQLASRSGLVQGGWGSPPPTPADNRSSLFIVVVGTVNLASEPQWTAERQAAKFSRLAMEYVVARLTLALCLLRPQWWQYSWPAVASDRGRTTLLSGGAVGGRQRAGPVSLRLAAGAISALWAREPPTSTIVQLADSMGDLLSAKRRDVFDRLRRRIKEYRRRHETHINSFEPTVAGFNDRQRQDTLLLRQRWLESKAKRAAKSKANKDPGSESRSNVLTVSTSHFSCTPWKETGHKSDGGVIWTHPSELSLWSKVAVKTMARVSSALWQLVGLGDYRHLFCSCLSSHLAGLLTGVGGARHSDYNWPAWLGAPSQNFTYGKDTKTPTSHFYYWH